MTALFVFAETPPLSIAFFQRDRGGPPIHQGPNGAPEARQDLFWAVPTRRTPETRVCRSFWAQGAGVKIGAEHKPVLDDN